MIKRKNNSIKKRKNSSKEEDRKKQLEIFLKTKGVKKLDYQPPGKRTKIIGDFKHDYRCSSCDGWEDEDGEFRHDLKCSKNKRKNPETVFGYIPQIGNLSFKQIETLVSGVDEAIYYYEQRKSKVADNILRKLDRKFGKTNVEKVYYYRKYNK